MRAVAETVSFIAVFTLAMMMIVTSCASLCQRYRESPSARYPSVCRPVDFHDGRPGGTACAYFERLGDALNYATETGSIVRVPPGYYR